MHYALMTYVDEGKLASPRYSDGFWEGVRAAVKGRKYSDEGGPEHSMVLCVPDVSADEWRQGYRHGFFAGKAMIENRN